MVSSFNLSLEVLIMPSINDCIRDINNIKEFVKDAKNINIVNIVDGSIIAHIYDEELKEAGVDYIEATYDFFSKKSSPELIELFFDSIWEEIDNNPDIQDMLLKSNYEITDLDIIPGLPTGTVLKGVEAIIAHRLLIQ